MSTKSKLIKNNQTINNTNVKLIAIKKAFLRPISDYTATGSPISTQEITPDSGKYLSKVTINPIPSNYIVPSGNKTITANGTNIDVSSYSTVSVNVPTSGSGSAIDGVELIDNDLYINSGNYGVMVYSSSSVYILRDNASVHISSPSTVSLESDTNLTYTSGTITCDNLTPENIKSGVSILGVTGTYEANTPSVSFDETTGTLTITTNEV